MKVEGPFTKRCTVSCPAALLMALLFSATARADDWPQWLGPQRDGSRNGDDLRTPVTIGHG